MSVLVIDTNVCIIGAGPSGSTTSIVLSKLGISHVIIDAAVFPRDKICGDVLDLKVIRVLNQISPSIVSDEMMHDENFVQITGFSVNATDSKNQRIQYEPKSSDPSFPLFFLCKRKYFDYFLVKKINPQYANFKQGTRVIKIEKLENGKWKIQAVCASENIEIYCNLLVGADGDHSIVLRSLGERKIDRMHYAGGLRQYWKGVRGMNNANHLELFFSKKFPLAYFWIFPHLNDETNVGYMLSSELIAKNNLNLKNIFTELLNEDAIISDKFKNALPLEKTMGWGLPLASGQRKASGDGWLLVGDAASLICPTTGEGIGPGMISGYIAAHFIARAVQQKQFNHDQFKNYDREIYKRLNDDISQYNLLRKLPIALLNFIISVITFKGFVIYFINKRVNKWVETAYQKSITIQFD